VLERLWSYAFWPGLGFEAIDVVAAVVADEFRVLLYILSIQFSFVLLLLFEILYRILLFLYNLSRNIFEFCHIFPQRDHEFVRLPADVGYQDDEDILKLLVNLQQQVLQWIGIHECGKLFAIDFMSEIKVDALIQQDLASQVSIHVAVTSHVDVKQHVLVIVMTIDQDVFSYCFLKQDFQLFERSQIAERSFRLV
jgi:hypothetical protein